MGPVGPVTRVHYAKAAGPRDNLIKLESPIITLSWALIAGNALRTINCAARPAKALLKHNAMPEMGLARQIVKLFAGQGVIAMKNGPIAQFAASTPRPRR